jgi:hypothetical protein
VSFFDQFPCDFIVHFKITSMQNLKLLQFLFCLFAPLWLFAQVNVSGTVMDANNVPIQGASVNLKNTNVGTSTDVNGKFSLTLPAKGGVLEISYVGLETQTVDVISSLSDLVIKMQEDVGHLEEV